MTDLLWQIPLVLLVGYYVIGLLVAPYQMDQERERTETGLREEIDRLRDSLTQKEEETARLRSHPAPPFQKVFEVEARKCHFSWVGQDGQRVPAGHPDIPKPPNATLEIQIETIFTAIPARAVGKVELVLLQQHFPQTPGTWESRRVGRYEFSSPILHFTLTPPPPPGRQSAQLIAYSDETHTVSAPFGLEIPR